MTCGTFTRFDETFNKTGCRSEIDNRRVNQ